MSYLELAKRKIKEMEQAEKAGAEQKEPAPTLADSKPEPPANPPKDQRPRLIARFSPTEGYQDFSNDNVRVELPALNPKNTVFYSDCSSCKDRHAIGQPCPEKSTDWMNQEGNKVVSKVSKSLDVWALSPRKEAILEALNKFDMAWNDNDSEEFRRVVKEIDTLLFDLKPR